MKNREEKLRAASERYGKPFKCGPTSLPREVFRGKVIVVAQGPEVPTSSSPKLILVERKP